MRDWLEIFFGASSGFGFYQLFSSRSHLIYIDRAAPKLAAKLRKAKRFLYAKFVKDIKVKKLEILPAFQIHHKNRSIHIHHWISLSVILGYLLYKSDNITQLTLLKSFLAGGAIQGFMYKDRFKIFKKAELNQSPNSK